jgi:hypothetical protein
MPTDPADKYATNLGAPAAAGAAVEPEAQLTTPVSVFLIAFCEQRGIGQLELFREAVLEGVRPDLDARLNGRQSGWIELKRPGHTLDGTKWRGRERSQWELLAELDPLIVTDGSQARLYRAGTVLMEDVHLPVNGSAGWDPKPLEKMLRLFVSVKPLPIKRVSQLSTRLAPLARMLRERISSGLTPHSGIAAIKTAKKAWATYVHNGASDLQFADDLAQVIAYSLAIASLQTDGGPNEVHAISLSDARTTIKARHGVLAAALGPALDVPGLYDALRGEIGAIERLVSGVDAKAIASSTDSRGEPWLWFYEDFLHTYDAKAQRKAGVYYTPTQVVGSQVRLVDKILQDTFGRPLGFGDKQVVTLDPATGSGTYPLAVLDQAAKVAIAKRGPAGSAQVAKNLVSNLVAFEILPGPYAVAHLRIGQRLAEMENALTPRANVRVYLTDTLDDPDREIPTLDIWGDPEVLAEERRHAANVKNTQPVTVIIGNPPYNRRDAESSGGWILHPNSGRSLFDDVLDPPKAANVIFSAMRSVYDDYAYFWRWAMWKAFEQDPNRDAVVSFITSSSWLTGPAFVGLRQLARKHADEMWIVDLGGQGRGAVKDENVFSIQTPVAIVTMFRKGKGSPSLAKIQYTRVRGRAKQKLEALSLLMPPSTASPDWTALVTETPSDSLVPVTGDGSWSQMPKLTDIFPWQQPGAIYARSWPIAPSAETLRLRWKELLSSENATVRGEKFVQAKSGRNVHTAVAGLATIASLAKETPPPAIVRYAYRSFDRQWVFEDKRLAKTESPSLWQSRSKEQIFLTSLPTSPLGVGPAVVATVDVPDFHHFRNRGGKDVMPLYRDPEATQPNLPAGLLDRLGEVYGRIVDPEEVMAYVYAILGQPAYQETFKVELETPGPRVPLTANPDLFNEGVDLGRRLLARHTWGERFSDETESEGLEDGLGWLKGVTVIPADPSDITYDASGLELHVGDGVISGVQPGVWAFQVSGMLVLQRWLAVRTAKGAGLSSGNDTAKPLDTIRPTEWEDDWNDELLALIGLLTRTILGYPAQADLLARILAGPLLSVDELPVPTAAERAVPKTLN